MCDNWIRLAALASASETAAVVKADAYGLGAEQVLPVLAACGVRSFFVASLDEGVEARTILGTTGSHRIFVLNGFAPELAVSYAEFDLIPVLNSLREIHACLASEAFDASLGVAIHLDTGMNRLGLSKVETEELAASIDILDRLNVALWMSHLACADELDHAFNTEQLARFKTALSLLPQAPASLANSAGIHLGADFHFDLVRPGISLYGGNPALRSDVKMKPVVTFSGSILQLRDLEPGETVGYGADYRAQGKTRIATVSAGYADGVLRTLGNNAQIRIRDTAVPLVGRVSMDLLAVDVSSLARDAVKEGDQVELLGADTTIDDLAQQGGTISYEILTRLGRRSARIYKPQRGEKGANSG